MNWELIGGIGAGLMDAKRQRDEANEVGEYRKEASALRKMQMEDLEERRAARRKSVGGDPVKQMGLPEQRRTDAGADVGGVGAQPYARGGMVGAENSEMSEWACDCSGFSSDLWQKQSFKK